MSPSALDPAAWPARLTGEALRLGAWLEGVPLWALAGLVALGALVLAFGARRRRPLALPGGALVGWLAGEVLAALLGRSGLVLPAIGAAAVGGGALAYPPVFPFAALALPGAFLGAAVPGGSSFIGAILGAALFGGLGLMAARLVAAASAGLAGAALVGAAVLGAAGRLPWLVPVASRPVLLAGLLLVLAVAGGAFQVSSAWGSGGGRRRETPVPPDQAETRTMQA